MPKATEFCSLAQFYRDLPLDTAKRCIRVIDIDGSSTPLATEERLCASMRVIELNAASRFQYATLSYVWGPPVDEDSPVINLQHGIATAELRLTKNCHEALINLRAKLGSFTIWIDAICINQNDMEEKASQIDQMELVYSFSKPTYIWFGPETKASRKSLEFLVSIGYTKFYFHFLKDGSFGSIYPRPWSTCSTFYWQSARSFWFVMRLILRGMTLKPPFDLLEQEEHLEILDQPWLQRIWTYQEIMLASTPVIVCGTDHVAWSAFVSGICFLQTQWFTQDLVSLNAISHKDNEQRLNTWYALARDRDLFQITKAEQKSDESAASELHFDRYEKFLRLASLYWCIVPAAIVKATETDQFKLCIRYVLSKMSSRSVNSLTRLIRFASLLFSGYTISQAAMSLGASFFIPKRTYLLEALWSRKCTIPADQNFGVRAILRSHLHGKLNPLDYDSDLRIVYSDLTWNVLKAFQDPEILDAAIRPQRYEGFPSWAVDWSRPRAKTSDYRPGHTSRLDLRFHSASILQLRAQLLGSVVSTFRFRYTALSFFDENCSVDEKNEHIENLKTMMSLLKFCPSFRVSSRNQSALRYLLAHLQDGPNFMVEKLEDPNWVDGAGMDRLIREVSKRSGSSLFVVEPICACGKCRYRIGVTDEHPYGPLTGLPVALGDWIMTAVGIPQSTVIRTNTTQSTAETIRYELVTKCKVWVNPTWSQSVLDVFEDWDFWGTWKMRKENFHICPKLKSDEMPYLDIC